MISLAYIVMNEEDYIERSILSATKIADEIIVIDGGSTDRTVEICKDLGAKVFFEEWRDDFSHSKNIMIDKCTGDWILHLDADEHLENENMRYFEIAMHEADLENVVAYQMVRKNHYPIHDSDSPFFSAPFYPDLQARFFRKNPEIYFSGRVHEGILQSIELSRVGEVGRIPVVIHHHMFRGNKEENESKKDKYYRKLLDIMNKENNQTENIEYDEEM